MEGSDGVSRRNGDDGKLKSGWMLIVFYGAVKENIWRIIQGVVHSVHTHAHWHTLIVSHAALLTIISWFCWLIQHFPLKSQEIARLAQFLNTCKYIIYSCLLIFTKIEIVAFCNPVLFLKLKRIHFYLQWWTCCYHLNESTTSRLYIFCQHHFCNILESIFHRSRYNVAIKPSSGNISSDMSQKLIKPIYECT